LIIRDNAKPELGAPGNVKYSPKIGQLVKLVKTLKSSSQYEADTQKIQP
jgi:hypothetical protein